MSLFRRLLGLCAAICFGAAGVAQQPDLSEYKTVEQAIPAKEIKEKPAAAQPGFLGVYAEDRDAKVVAADVATESPAAKAGVKSGDVIAKIDGQQLTDAESFREALRAKGPGVAIKLGAQKYINVNLHLFNTTDNTLSKIW